MSRGAAGGAAQQFPTSDGTAKADSACVGAGGCLPGNGQKFVAPAGTWAAEPWNSLKFELHDPQYYAYQFTESGTGTGARFSAAAYGNLDGDAVYSTFEMQATVGSDGSVQGQGAMFKAQPQE